MDRWMDWVPCGVFWVDFCDFLNILINLTKSAKNLTKSAQSLTKIRPKSVKIRQIPPKTPTRALRTNSTISLHIFAYNFVFFIAHHIISPVRSTLMVYTCAIV